MSLYGETVGGVHWSFRIVGAVALLLPIPVSAHHSNSCFDLDRLVTFQGTVVSFEWTNPHVYLTVDDENGVEWLIETDATPVMSRSGWTRDSFVPGDAVTVRANPDRRSDKAHALLLSVDRSDGASLTSWNRAGRFVDSESTTARDLGGVWRGEISTARAFINTMLDHPLTEKGEAARAEYDQTKNPTVACVTWPTPWIVGGYLYLHEVELGEDVIVYRNEFYGTERVIYMDGRDHPDGGERTNQGHSIGWWEGDSLVVDTTLFADHRSPHAATAGVPSGSQKHVIERYRLNESGTQATIDVFLEDPEYLAEPVTAQLTWTYSPHLEMLNLNCDAEVSTRFTH